MFAKHQREKLTKKLDVITATKKEYVIQATTFKAHDLEGDEAFCDLSRFNNGGGMIFASIVKTLLGEARIDTQQQLLLVLEVLRVFHSGEVEEGGNPIWLFRGICRTTEDILVD